MPHLASDPSMRAKSVASDDYTLYSDADSVCSDMSSVDSLVTYFAHDELPAFRLPKEDAHNKDVYEAWTIYLSSDYKAAVSARKICGITVTEDFDSYQGTISTMSELYDQKDLREMHFKALDKYKDKHNRDWPSRIVRGKSPTYEEDIDSRMRKLPDAVQSEISNLLADREESSSNRFHNRVWTVVMMQEQLHRRFANADPTVVPKRHKVRFWKNPGKNQRSEYLLIIRGGEGRRVTGEKGQSEFRRFDNPWRKADDAEMYKKALQQRTRRRERVKEKEEAKVAPLPTVTAHHLALPRRYSTLPDKRVTPRIIRLLQSCHLHYAPMQRRRHLQLPYQVHGRFLLLPLQPHRPVTQHRLRFDAFSLIITALHPFPSFNVPPTLRPGPPHEPPSNSPQHRFWNSTGDPYSCCGPTVSYGPPVRQFYPTSNLQPYRPYEQVNPSAQSAFRVAPFVPPQAYPRPHPYGMAPIKTATPSSVSSASSSVTDVSSTESNISTDRKSRVDYCDTGDEEASVMDDDDPSNSADGTR